MFWPKQRKTALLCWLITGLCLMPAIASAAEILELRASSEAGRTRLVFALSQPTHHRIFTLQNPDRLVIDLPNGQLQASLPNKFTNIPLITGVRSAPRNQNDLRVVLDLASAAHVKSFMLPAASGQSDRLVIDLQPTTAVEPVLAAAKTLPATTELRDVIIAIDPGHGGKDPGALGRNGTQEKQVVMAIANELAYRVNQQRGMRAVLTRQGDYYLELRERINKARELKADLFISIHADAFKDQRARGASVYALSLRGATSEAAKWLADQENAADLVGGVSLDDKDQMVASVLLDLAQTATIQSSLDLGGEILQEMGGHTHLHKSSVQQAGFLVLKSPDIPSILVETAFISNPNEERKLTDKTYQRKLANSILSGIKSYFQRKAPPGTLLAYENQQRHDAELKLTKR